MSRYLAPLIIGVVGFAVLISLGIWQVQRLAWKEGVLTDIDTRIAADPVPVPTEPDPEDDRYLPVVAEGLLTGEELRVLASVKRQGAVHRFISVLETPGGRILVDRGIAPVAVEPDLATGPLTVTGNLHWPDEVDSFTPDPDLAQGLWFARDVPAMAAQLNTQPVLIVARQTSPTSPDITPLPVSTEGIPNDHLEYAITWFSLSAVWAGMTAFLLWRIRRRTV